MRFQYFLFMAFIITVSQPQCTLMSVLGFCDNALYQFSSCLCFSLGLFFPACSLNISCLSRLGLQLPALYFLSRLKVMSSMFMILTTMYMLMTPNLYQDYAFKQLAGHMTLVAPEVPVVQNFLTQCFKFLSTPYKAPP